jgi:hypothetical protein
VEDFGTSWPKVFQQFPIYVSILHLIKIVTGLSSHITVITFAVVMFGVFSISLFFFTQRLLHLSKWQGVFITLFVILQIAVLRTAMNNHRDIFALSTMFFTISLIYRGKSRNGIKWPTFMTAVVLTAATVCSDGMIGLLLVVTLVVYSVITFKKIIIICALVAISFLAYAVSLQDNPIRENIEANSNYFSQSVPSRGSYEPLNLLLIFVTLNGFLIPTGIIGFRILKNNLLTIPLLVCIPLSFSWLLFPDNPALVPHRWTVLLGIFLSIFAAYGIIHLASRLHSVKKQAAILSGVIAITVIFGFAYTTMPRDESFIYYGAPQNQLRIFFGIAMQPDREHNSNLRSAISWINENTESDAIIVGSSLFRGWMQTYLADDRVFKFSLNLEDPVLDVSNHHDNGYFIVSGENKYPKDIDNSLLNKVYSQDDFTVFRIKHNEKILPTISWLNENTEHDAIILGKKYLIDWMESGLEGNRTYKSSACEYNCHTYWEYQIAALKNQPQKHGYLILYNSNTPEIINNESLSKVYANDKFTVFRIAYVN